MTEIFTLLILLLTEWLLCTQSFLLGSVRPNNFKLKFGISFSQSNTKVNVIDFIQNSTLYYGENWNKISRHSQLGLTPKDCKSVYMKTLRSFDDYYQSRVGENSDWDQANDDELLSLYESNPYLTSPLPYLRMHLNSIIRLINYRNRVKTTESIDMLPNILVFSGWRNISHTMFSATTECRKRLYYVKFNIDLTTTADYWYDWEYIQLFILVYYSTMQSDNQVGDHDVKFHEIGRTLGRTAMQCYHCYTNNKLYQYYSDKINEYIDNSIIPLNSTHKNILTTRNTTLFLENLLTVKTLPTSRRASTAWSDIEDNLLLSYVEQYGFQWRLICSLLEESSFQRTSKVCYARYHNLIKSRSFSPSTFDINNINYNNENKIINIVSGHRARKVWNETNLSQLCSLVQQYGADWKRILTLLNISTSVQAVRSAYVNQVRKHPTLYLMPSARRSSHNSANSNQIINTMSTTTNHNNNKVQMLSSNIFSSPSTTTVTNNNKALLNWRDIILNSKQIVYRKLKSNRNINNNDDNNNRDVLIDLLTITSSSYIQSTAITSNKWSKTDDILLQNLIYLYTNKHINTNDDTNKHINTKDDTSSMSMTLTMDDWLEIAERMSRSPEDIMIRYDFKLNKQKNLKNGYWTKAEDKLLLQYVQDQTLQQQQITNSINDSDDTQRNNIMISSISWSKIGDLLNRSGAQCSLRYRVSLDPRLKWKLWTSEEDQRLVVLRDEMGYNWVMISAVLDRASSSCRYRYLNLKKNRINEFSDNNTNLHTESNENLTDSDSNSDSVNYSRVESVDEALIDTNNSANTTLVMFHDDNSSVSNDTIVTTNEFVTIG